MDTLEDARQALLKLMEDKHYQECMAIYTGSYHEFDEYSGQQYGIYSCCLTIGVTHDEIKNARIAAENRFEIDIQNLNRKC